MTALLMKTTIRQQPLTEGMNRADIHFADVVGLTGVGRDHAE